MLFAWQGFELEHPDDWECVRFSKNRRRGECALADHSGQRLLLNWHAAKAGHKADLGSMMAELSQQLGKADRKGRAGPQRTSGPWTLMDWIGSAGTVTLALAQFSERGLIVKAEFTPRGTDSDRRRDALLQSFRCRGTTEEWHWSAFGCRLHLPCGLELEKCEVLPGKATLEFRQKAKPAQTFRLQRLAMPELQLKGRSLKDFFSATISDRDRLIESRQDVFRGHDAFWATVRPLAGSAWQRLRQRKWRGRAAMWVCEREQRLYRTEWDGSPAAQEPRLEAWVECQ